MNKYLISNILINLLMLALAFIGFYFENSFSYKFLLKSSDFHSILIFSAPIFSFLLLIFFYYLIQDDKLTFVNIPNKDKIKFSSLLIIKKMVSLLSLLISLMIFSAFIFIYIRFNPKLVLFTNIFLIITVLLVVARNLNLIEYEK